MEMFACCEVSLQWRSGSVHVQTGDEVCILFLRVMDSHTHVKRHVKRDILRMYVASNLTVCCHLYLGCQGTHAHGFLFFDF